MWAWISQVCGWAEDSLGVTGCEYRAVENNESRQGTANEKEALTGVKGEQNPIIIQLRRSPAFRNSFSQRQETTSSATLPQSPGGHCCKNPATHMTGWLSYTGHSTPLPVSLPLLLHRLLFLLSEAGEGLHICLPPNLPSLSLPKDSNTETTPATQLQSHLCIQLSQKESLDWTKGPA